MNCSILKEVQGSKDLPNPGSGYLQETWNQTQEGQNGQVSASKKDSTNATGS
jgi:hypothetical protein